MTIVDVSVVPVREDRKDAYLDFSRRMAEVYRDHGATRIAEYWQAGVPADPSQFHADGVEYEAGELRDLAQVMGAQEREAVVVTITEWPSHDVRERGTASATRDPRVLATLEEDPVFEGHRLVAGTFEQVMESADPV